jgi:hypothetical protein
MMKRPSDAPRPLLLPPGWPAERRTRLGGVMVSGNALHGLAWALVFDFCLVAVAAVGYVVWRVVMG